MGSTSRTGLPLKPRVPAPLAEKCVGELLRHDGSAWADIRIGVSKQADGLASSITLVPRMVVRFDRELVARLATEVPVGRADRVDLGALRAAEQAASPSWDDALTHWHAFTTDVTKSLMGLNGSALTHALLRLRNMTPWAFFLMPALQAGQRSGIPVGAVLAKGQGSGAILYEDAAPMLVRDLYRQHGQDPRNPKAGAFVIPELSEEESLFLALHQWQEAGVIDNANALLRLLLQHPAGSGRSRAKGKNWTVWRNGCAEKVRRFRTKRAKYHLKPLTIVFVDRRLALPGGRQLEEARRRLHKARAAAVDPSLLAPVQNALMLDTHRMAARLAELEAAGAGWALDGWLAEAGPSLFAVLSGGDPARVRLAPLDSGSAPAWRSHWREIYSADR